ncbi:uroporphyrinogen-III synthase [Cellulomonas soli]|uniref:uroporphyrinogen-III synthase n=1 Tax=Cellulomonas soli TaxID=931535 RepID=UPI003F82C387
MTPTARTGRGPLDGLRVLVPRPTAGTSPAVVALAAAGAQAVVVPLIETVLPDDPTELDDTLLALGAGWYTWLVLTSAAAVPVLVDRATEVDAPLPELVARTGTRVAAVGPGTARALREAGVPVDVVPTVGSTALRLLGALPEGPGRILFPRGDLASATLAAGLRERAWEVDDVIAYRTVPAAPPPADVVEDWRAGRIDAALLTSASTVRELAAHLGAPPAGTLLVCIGPSTAAEAHRLGLPVAAVAAEQTMLGLVGALTDAHAAAHTPSSPRESPHESPTASPEETV